MGYLENSTYTESIINIPWLCAVLYFCGMVAILFLNEALNSKTLIDFTSRLKSLVEELTLDLEPCTFPVDLIVRFHEELEKRPSPRELSRIALQGKYYERGINYSYIQE